MFLHKIKLEKFEEYAYIFETKKRHMIELESEKCLPSENNDYIYALCKYKETLS